MDHGRALVGHAFSLLADSVDAFLTITLASEVAPDGDWTGILAAADARRSQRPTSDRSYSRSDPSCSLRIFSERPIEARAPLDRVFGKRWDSRVVSAYAAELRGSRNSWAHNNPVRDEDWVRALDTMERLLVCINRPEHLAWIRGTRRQLEQRIVDSPLAPAVPVPNTAKNVRVHELAKELGAFSQELLFALKQIGVPAKSASSTIDGSDAARIRSEIFFHGKNRLNTAHYVLAGRPNPVHTVCCDPERERLFCGDAGGIVSVYDYGQQRATKHGEFSTQLREEPSEGVSVAVSPDGSLLATVSRGGSAARLWDARTFELRSEFPCAAGNRVAFSPDGQDLAICGSRGVAIYKIATQMPRSMLGSTAAVDVTFSRDSTTIAVANENCPTPVVHRLTQGSWVVQALEDWQECVHDETKPSVVALSPDGTLLASGGADPVIYIWDLSIGRLVALLTGLTGSVNALSFCPDGKSLATGGSDGILRIWNVAEQRCAAVLSGHAGAVTTLACNADDDSYGAVLMTGGVDGTIRAWAANRYGRVV